MNTFILEWRPSISSYKMEAFEEDFHFMEYGEFNWSVWDWQKARSGDNFYMIKCGEGQTGIVMKGFFLSGPYEADDWSGKQREVHYMDYRPTVMIHPSCPKGIITTQQLEKEFPDFEWNGSHSGRLLPDDIAKRLDAMWEDYIGQFSKEDADGKTLEFNFIPEAIVDDAIRQVSRAMYDSTASNGEPLVYHSLKVGLAGKTKDAQICGFLHHVLDLPGSEVSAGSLRDEGFSERIIDTLLLLSHPDGLSDEEYLQQIASCGNEVAIEVAKNNIRVLREDALKKGDEDLEKRYSSQLAILPLEPEELVRKELEEHLGHPVSQQFFDNCWKAYRKGYAGPTGLGGAAVLGNFTPFESVLEHKLYVDHSCWPCREAIDLGRFFKNAVEKHFGTKK